MASADTACYFFPDISRSRSDRVHHPEAPLPKFRRLAVGAAGGPGDSACGFVRTKDRLSAGSSATLEELEQNAYCRGFADGEKKGFEQGSCAGTALAEKRLDPLLGSLSQMLSELQTLRRQTCADLESELVELALAVARKIVGREVDANPDRIADIIRNAIRRVPDAPRITIRLNPSDLRHLNETRPQLLAGLAGAQRASFETDAGIDLGGCFIETDAGDVDARIQHQLEVVDAAFCAERRKNSTLTD